MYKIRLDQIKANKPLVLMPYCEEYSKILSNLPHRSFSQTEISAACLLILACVNDVRTDSNSICVYAVYLDASNIKLAEKVTSGFLLKV